MDPAVELASAHPQAVCQNAYVERAVTQMCFHRGEYIFEKSLILRSRYDPARLHNNLAAEGRPHLSSGSNKVVQTCIELIDVKWFGEVVVCPQFQTAETFSLICQSGQQHHRRQAQLIVTFDPLTEIESAEPGHHHVAHDHIGPLLTYRFPGLQSGFRLQ